MAATARRGLPSARKGTIDRSAPDRRISDADRDSAAWHHLDWCGANISPLQRAAGATLDARLGDNTKPDRYLCILHS